MATQHKTASTHRSAIVRGAHQLDIVGYSTRRKFGADNTVRSRSFDAGGFVWALVCRFVAKPAQARGLTLSSISIELSRNQTDEDVVAMASIRIDDPTGCGRYPAAEWHSAEPHTFPAWSRKAVAWQLSVPDVFVEHEERYVMDDCLTIHCAVDVIREESVDGATRNYSVVVPPPPSLSQDIHRLRQEMWWPDVTFVVDQTKIQAHKLVLAMRSPVFAAQFHGEMKEKTMRCLRIDDMSASTFNAMLHFIYTDELPKPNKGASHLAMARDLLVAADLYDLERLRLMCENILSKSITVGNVMATLMLVHNRHSCRQLEACCVEFIASDPDLYNAVQATDEYKELEKECPSFMYETIKKVATLAVARKKSPSTSSTGHVTNSRESVSRYNPSAVMIGTHEFRIESLKAIRKTHSVGQYIQSGSFQVGGYEWAISVYPSGFEGDETEYIGLFLRRLSDNNDDDDADDDNDGGGGEEGDNNDDDADDYVKALLTFKLKDPTGNSPAHQKKITHVYDNGLGEGYGISDFITMESVNSHYLGHDGSLTVQCRVEVTTMSCTSSTVVAGTVIPVLQSNLALHLEQLLVSENGWDVKFLVEDSEIRAHGLVVATRSPALQEEVESATGMDHVKIDAMRATVFKAILYFIYTDELPRVDDHVPVVGGDSTMIAGEMLAAASRFRLERMKRLCENLLAENITPKNALATLRIAGRHGCTELEGHCVEYMSLPHVAKDVMKSLKSFL